MREKCWCTQVNKIRIFHRMHNAQHDCTECQRTSNYMIGKIMERDIKIYKKRERAREEKCKTIRESKHYSKEK